MWVILVILLAIFLLVAWILIAPLTFYADTREQILYVRLWGLFKVSAVWKDKLLLRCRLLFIPFTIDPFKPEKKKRKKKKAKKPKEKKKKSSALDRKSATAIMRMVKTVLKSFRVKSFRLDLDTDDYVLNSELIPVFSLINRGNVHMTSNYQGIVYLHVEIENRLYRVAWAFILFYVFKK